MLRLRQKPNIIGLKKVYPKNAQVLTLGECTFSQSVRKRQGLKMYFSKPDNDIKVDIAEIKGENKLLQLK